MTHRVLFVCAKNRLRSPTAEHVFSDWEGVETSSAGINRDADSPVTPELLDWADTILVMEPSHRAKLVARFGSHLRGKRVVSLGIPDDYEYMAPALVELLLAKVPRHLPPRK
ncbi:protein-tyrosine-phosphatase [Arenimonas soli]|uniref:Protein-tyrosine-phosphatase n=1 Tax=Arenimonas soli TaxID=2269504 RepID=A0ABQ1HSD9_9GAMM|nr:phosphotyrosine protein phosphatase [Arenimonas soli]GGA88156.1 protein-tyrosine-phosphatase [Arenimonas soli]